MYSIAKKSPLLLCKRGGNIQIERVKGSEDPRPEIRDLSDRGPANTEETEAPTPATVEQKEVEHTLAAVAPQSRDITVQKDLGDRAETDDRELPLFLGVFLPEGEDVADSPSVVAVFLHQSDGFFGRDVAVEVEELPLPVAHLLGGDGELLLGEVAIVPAVVAARDAILERDVGFDGQELLGLGRNCYAQITCGREDLNLEFAGENPENLLMASRLLDQRVELAGGEILGCEIGHDHLHWASVPARIISSPGDTGLWSYSP